MLTDQFKTLLVCVVFSLIVILMAYAIHCKRRSKSYFGTGRVVEIETYELKATFSWIITFCLTMALLSNFL